MSVDLNQIENRLWAAADQLWANTGLKPSEFSNPVLGLIFLRYAEKRFHEAEVKLIEKGLDAFEIEKFDYQAEGALYLPDNARFSYLFDLAEGHDLGKAVNEAMVAVEAENEELRGVLPRSFGRLLKIPAHLQETDLIASSSSSAIAPVALINEPVALSRPTTMSPRTTAA